MMRCGFRLALCILLVLLVPLYLIKAHLEDLCDQYRAGAYLVNWLDINSSEYEGVLPKHDLFSDKVIVMAKLEEEPTEWVEAELPDWKRAIYVVNPSRATAANEHKLKTPLNKGHESMAYLTYMIDYYDRLPSIVAFLHAHRGGFLMAWHVDAPLHDNVAAMRSLQLDFVRQNGYVNLRCNWNPGCKAAHRINRHVTNTVWQEVFEGTSTPPLNVTISASLAENGAMDAARNQRFLPKPREIGAACCAQFAVSREQVLQRPREDYVKFRQWIMDTDLDDASSGRIMEFLWHVIFGKESVYCPDEEVCHCQVYGRC